eukprot:4748748-Pleurochrysis_carterae.AAC.1
MRSWSPRHRPAVEGTEHAQDSFGPFCTTGRASIRMQVRKAAASAQSKGEHANEMRSDESEMQTRCKRDARDANEMQTRWWRV